MNNTIDFNTAKTIGTMSKKIDHIDDTVVQLLLFHAHGHAERTWQCRAILCSNFSRSGFDRDPA